MPGDALPLARQGVVLTLTLAEQHVEALLTSELPAPHRVLIAADSHRSQVLRRLLQRSGNGNLAPLSRPVGA